MWKFQEKYEKIMWAVLQNFCTADLFSAKINKWTSKKKILLQVIIYFSHNHLTQRGIFYTDRWVCWCLLHATLVLLFDSLQLRGSWFLLICPTLNLFTHWFTVDFVITFCAPYTVRILKWISLRETFSSVKNWITLHCSF